MIVERIQHLEGHRSDVCTGLGALHHVHGMAQGRGQNLRLESVIPVNKHDVLDERDTVLRYVVQAADEWAYKVGSSLGNKQRLRRREAKGHIDLDPLVRKDF